jgi:hypothetical protein
VRDPILTALVIVTLSVVALACGALYFVAQWYLLRRFGSVVVLVVWFGLAFGLAYAALRYACSQGLACNVGGVDYHGLYVSRFAFIVAATLGVCTLLVLRRGKRSARPARRDVLIGATSFLIVSFAAPWLLMALNTVTCGNRAMRRADGAYITECEYRAEEKASERAHAGR